MVNINAQEWIDKKYPKDAKCKRDNDPENKNKRRSEIVRLDISKGKVGKGIFNNGGNTLTGSLKLEGFVKLRTLIIYSHQLTDLDVSECNNLEELDCQDNKIDILNVNNCSNLKKINCSNNDYIQELDLSTCPNLDEVDVKGCSKLTEDKVNSILSYDKESGRLFKGKSQIALVEEGDIRNVLIVGWAGNGKSTLANVLSKTNMFSENAGGLGETLCFKRSKIFRWKENNYRIIDNIGFGDNNIPNESDLLYRVGEGVYAAKEGINQVLFVVGGRFSEEQIMGFNMFKNFISESGVTKFTTIIRTNFPNFRNEQKCEDDKETLLTQTKELREMIESCNDIIYVENPPIPIIEDEDSEGEKEIKSNGISISEKNRKKSREKVLDHLVNNCPNIYKLDGWDNISSMVDRYNNKKEKLKKSTVDANERSAKEKKLKAIRDEVVGEVKERILKLRLEASVPIIPLTLQIEVPLKNK